MNPSEKGAVQARCVGGVVRVTIYDIETTEQGTVENTPFAYVDFDNAGAQRLIVQILRAMRHNGSPLEMIYLGKDEK